MNMISFIGAAGLAVGFALIVYNVYYSIRYSPRNIGSDPWDARSLEWATHNPVPEYNFASIPQVNSIEALWDAKKKGHDLFPGEYEKIHMPNNSGCPFIMSAIFFVWGFSFVFAYGFLLSLQQSESLLVCLRSFEKDHGHYISVEEIEETEKNCEVLNNENR